MNIKKLRNNETLLTTNHGCEILYSYETPVAGFSVLCGFFKTSEHYSTTTTKHINRYLRGIESSRITILAPNEIELMFLEGANYEQNRTASKSTEKRTGTHYGDDTE